MSRITHTTHIVFGKLFAVSSLFVNSVAYFLEEFVSHSGPFLRHPACLQEITSPMPEKGVGEHELEASRTWSGEPSGDELFIRDYFITQFISLVSIIEFIKLSIY